MKKIYNSIDFYIYRWIRLDTNQPFHVGKGSGDRAYNILQRNPYFLNIMKKVICKVEIFINNLTEQQALDKEIEFIKLYKSFGLCVTNLTDGGEGVSGYKHTEDTKKLISEASVNMWSDPEMRAKMSTIIKEVYQNTDLKERLSRSIKKSMSTQEYRKKRSEYSTKMWKDAKYAKKQSDSATKMWENVEFKTKMCEKQNKRWEKAFNVFKMVGNRLNTIKGEFVGTWMNQITCSHDLHLKLGAKGHVKGISENLHGRCKSCQGYIFEYVV